MKAYATYNPYVHLESDITPNDYILSRKHNVNMLRLDKYEMKETHLQSELSAYNRESHKLRAKYKKTIYSAIRYFNRIGYKMNYILDEKNEKGIKLDTDNTKFSLNLLKLLIESEGINDVKELEIVKTTGGELSSDVTYDDITFKFHEAYSATFDSIVRSYIKLKLIYPCKETLIKVIGYIIDNESALKTIESRLISYRQRYKMAIEYKVIIKALESEISKLELSSYDEKQVENAKRLTVNFAFKIISDKMVKDFKNGEYSMRLSKLDETAMRIALMTKIEELIEKLYKNFYTSKSFRKKIEDTVDKEDTSVYTTWKDLSRMSIIKSSEQYSLEADASLFEQAMSTLSSKDSFTIDDSLDGLITRLNGALDEKYFDVFMLLDYTAKTTFSMMFVGDNQDDRVKFANAIKKFNAENKNFRGEYAFICVDKYGNVVALEVKLDDLFDRLTEKGIVKKMRSFRGGVEYFRRRSFKTKYSDCKNYTVKKIMIK
ncbi:hypothetical protein JCM19314_3732 [Nonlabens ulvanivorans]|uniref:Uncharacterized protein n=1 Tax=Nonlabens ulvanivorans TaxID=906888 RepID=A0A090QBT7_NONUL|nr:hypothetical protein [Nonlabens ulvanivorans]GAK99687.1 hypothetical protein JCM19314_3732 [Nonlabens ulvanivorans]